MFNPARKPGDISRLKEQIMREREGLEDDEEDDGSPRPYSGRKRKYKGVKSPTGS